MNTRRISVGIVVILFGSVIAGGGWYLYQTEQADIENAVEVEGVIEGTSIDRDVDRRDTNNDGVRERETSFRPIVNYTYTYEGEEYVSDSVYPGAENSFDTRSAATDVTEEFAEGESVAVYVNSEEPSRAFLIEQSDPIVYFAMIGMGALVAVFGLIRGAKGLVSE